MSKAKSNSDYEIAGSYPIAPFKIMINGVTKFYPDNLYLAQNKFFYKLLINKKNGQIDIKYVSSLYYKIMEDKALDEREKNKKNLEYRASEKDEKMLSSLIERMELITKLYLCSCNFIYRPETRLMVGTGGESPYSNVMLMTLHQTYGFPYIPATAIKGCLRNYCEQEKPDDFNIEKLLGADSGGKVKSKGCLVFFDTLPSEYTLAFDCMTPHNAEYFKSVGKKPPTDVQNKIPLYFPCVTKDSSFKIHIACTDHDEWDKNSFIISNCLKNALRDYGIGAKTSYGYGLAADKN